MNLFYAPALLNGILRLSEDESHHALKVLRLKAGDELRATDGVGSFYDCQVTDTTKGVCQVKVLKKTTPPHPGFRIHLAVGIIKTSDRMEWLVEKATELGVEQISFFTPTRSERKKANQDRLRKIALSAMKQSLQPWLPFVDVHRDFSDLITEPGESQTFIAHAGEGVPHLKDVVKKKQHYLILIGPEGDFTNEELEEARVKSITMVGLGPHRLRTETAAIAACHVLNLVNE